jgi:hypothetical protein
MAVDESEAIRIYAIRAAKQPGSKKNTGSGIVALDTVKHQLAAVCIDEELRMKNARAAHKKRVEAALGAAAK